MKSKRLLVFTQPITRVHNIFRLRTVVNAVTKENRKRKYPTDDEIGLVLAQTGLSKFRKERIQDRIMRRARDHLLTACYMGLLTRTDRPFGYHSTTAGRSLSSYGINEECPKDAWEEAVFIDKIMRLKLTNVYDLQFRGQYANLRSRPCLFILHILSLKDWLHEHQISIATGGKRCDPVLIDRSTSKTLNDVIKHDGLSKATLSVFYKDHGIKDAHRKNMTRNVRPLLDWCESTGLVESREVEGVSGRWYKLTSRGSQILRMYSSKYPVWLCDIAKLQAAKAAVLLFYSYARMLGLTFDDSILDLKLQTGFVRTSISELVSELEEDLDLGLFADGHLRLSKEIDFTLEYDIPPNLREDALAFLKSISHAVHIRTKDLIQRLEKDPIELLKLSFQKEEDALKTVVVGDFARRTAISSDPVLAKVANVVPSVGVLGQYRSDFEKEVALLLRLIGLNAVKYQGQLADRCRKSHIMRFFENNPDILIINHIESLVECKSTGEWHPPLSGVKSVPKEIVIYQQYFHEVKSNSVVIIYEGTLDQDSNKHVQSILDDADVVVFVTKSFLVNAVHTPTLFRKLVEVIKEPKKFGADQRILSR